MPKTTQLVLTLQSKPGVLAGISRALAAARVNILSLSAAEAAGRGKIRMIVSNPVAARRTLRKARIRFSEEPAFTKRLRNKPGAPARAAPSSARARATSKTASRPPPAGAAPPASSRARTPPRLVAPSANPQGTEPDAARARARVEGIRSQHAAGAMRRDGAQPHRGSERVPLGRLDPRSGPSRVRPRYPARLAEGAKER